MKNYNLKQLRLANRLNQEAMAKEIGMARSTYISKENGRCEFSVGEIKSIARVFKLDIKDINRIFFSDIIP